MRERERDMGKKETISNEKREVDRDRVMLIEQEIYKAKGKKKVGKSKRE